MKKFTLVICILVLLLLPAAVSAVGNISVSSIPSGAVIILDSSSTGSVTQSTIENVPAGSHTILLQKSGYQDITQSNVVVSDNSTSIVSLTMTAVIVAPVVSSSSPTYGYNTTSVNNVIIYGSGFSTSGATVVLAKSGQTNITGTISSASATQLTCSFPIAGKPAGYWDVIVTNADGQSGSLSSGFEIRSSSSTVTLSSVLPTSAVTNTTASITSLSGTNFLTSATIRLKRAGYNDIYGTVSSLSSTTISGTFDLTNQFPGDYQVCVINPSTEAVCGLSFTVTSAAAANGSICVKASPSTSKIFLNSVFQGYTPMTLDNLTPTTYTVLIRSAGYNDYSESVTVTAGKTSSVIASLVLTPDVTTITTTAPRTTVSTVKTTVKSTKNVPKPWPSATPTSPVSVFAILGAVGVGFIVLREP